MAFENLETAIQIWLQDMEHGPEDRHEAYARLHELISEIRATGMPVPEDLKAYERELEAQFEADNAEGDEGNESEDGEEGSSEKGGN